MVVLHFTPNPQTVCRQLSSSPLTFSVTSNAFSRARIDLQTALFNGLRIKEHKQSGPTVVKDGAQPPESGIHPSETKDETLSVEKLPLESKLQLTLDQKIKMKLAKKLRLRRKRLVTKRQLRKKGRWPPSKMKKNKNV